MEIDENMKYSLYVPIFLFYNILPKSQSVPKTNKLIFEMSHKNENEFLKREKKNKLLKAVSEIL